MITCQLRKKRDHSFISQDRLDLLSGCVSPNPHLLLFFQFPTFPTHNMNNNKNQSKSKWIHSLQFKWEGSHVTCVSYNEDKNQHSQRKYLFIYFLSETNQIQHKTRKAWLIIESHPALIRLVFVFSTIYQTLSI